MNLLPRVEKAVSLKAAFFWVNRLREHGERRREETELTCQPNANQLGETYEVPERRRHEGRGVNQGSAAPSGYCLHEQVACQSRGWAQLTLPLGEITIRAAAEVPPACA